MSDELALRSPLTLIHQADSANEVLLLSFSLNLGFWERHALGRARALGALVTLVADPLVVEVDTAAVRQAGVAYVDGRAVCRRGGAFHPKVLVVTGEEHAHVAVGSGNVTLGGWHGNAELWTVLHAGTDEAPRALAGIADWLTRLPEHVEFSPKVADALGRTAAGLRRFPGNGGGPVLVHNLDAAIIDALPEGQVDELVLFAPFLDRDSEAIDAVAAKLQPQRLRVLIQPHQTVLDGSRLATVVASHGGEVALLRSDRYHHGKLIEWQRGGERVALVGSPNLSRSALLAPTSDGGNCEIALLCDLQRSLAPETGDPLDSEEVAALEWRPRVEPRPGLVRCPGFRRGSLICFCWSSA